MTSVEPAEALPGATITINGAHLKSELSGNGQTSGSTRVTVDGELCSVVTSTTLVIKCKLPQSFPKGQDVKPSIIVSVKGEMTVDSVPIPTYFSTIYKGITVLGKSKGEWFKENLMLVIGVVVAAICVIFTILFLGCVCVKNSKPTYKQRRSWTISVLFERQQTGTQITKSSTQTASSIPESTPFGKLDEDSGSSAIELSDREDGEGGEYDKEE